APPTRRWPRTPSCRSRWPPARSIPMRPPSGCSASYWPVADRAVTLFLRGFPKTNPPRGAFMKRIAWPLPLCALAACLSSHPITYALDPEEFAVDVGTASGNLPAVDCSANAQVCSTMTSLPPEAKTSCDPATRRCVADYDFHLVQQVN